MSNTQTMEVTKAIQQLNKDTKSLIEYNFKTFKEQGGFGEAAISCGETNYETDLADNQVNKNAKVIVLYHMDKAIAPKTKASAVMTDRGYNVEDAISEINNDLIMALEELLGVGTAQELEEILGV